MNLEMLFDLICAHHNAKGRAFKFNGKTVNERTYGTVLNKSVQAFVHGIGQPQGNKKIQAFEGSSSLPQLTSDVFNVTMAVDYYDLMWQNVFKGIRLKKGQLSWEISDVSSSIVFELIPEGGKVKFEGISGATATVNINKYGAGLGVTWETIEGRKLYKFVEQMEAMRSALYNQWATIHYGLLATAGATNQIAWQGTATDRTIDRDILTLNLGAHTIFDTLKDKGYGFTAKSPLVLYADPFLISRMSAALKATNADVTRAGSRGETLSYNITPYYSYNSNIPTNKGLLVLPGRKIQNSVYLRELGLSKREIESLNELRTYWTAFGAAIGDQDQVWELAFA